MERLILLTALLLAGCATQDVASADRQSLEATVVDAAGKMNQGPGAVCFVQKTHASVSDPMIRYFAVAMLAQQRGADRQSVAQYAVKPTSAENTAISYAVKDCHFDGTPTPPTFVDCKLPGGSLIATTKGSCAAQGGSL